LTPFIITQVESASTATMLTDFALSSRVSVASFVWMGAVLTIEDWRQDPIPAKQTVATQGIDLFIAHMGSLTILTSDQNQDDASKLCIRSGGGIPFIGSIVKTLRCIIKMAVEVGSTFQHLLDTMVNIHEAVAISGAQLATLSDIVSSMASPYFKESSPVTSPVTSTSNPKGFSLSKHSDSSVLQKTVSLFKSSMSQKSNELTTDASTSTSSVTSSSSSNVGCPLLTATDISSLRDFFTRRFLCLNQKLFGATCEACKIEQYEVFFENTGRGTESPKT
jgi:hypothetical protein